MARNQRKYDAEYKVQAVKLSNEIGSSKAATAGATVSASGGHSGENSGGQKRWLQKVGNQVQPERDVQDAAVFARAEDQQCRGAAKTVEGQGVGCRVRRTADQEESGLPGLPQGTE